jgi:biopolymer transport protein ExbD
MGNRYIGDRREPIATISLVPMIGVVFVLACLFLAANGAPTRTLRLAEQEAIFCTLGMEPPVRLELGIAPDGTAWERAERLSDAALEARVIELGLWPNKRLMLQPDPDLRYERIAEITALAHRAHIAEVSVTAPMRIAEFIAASTKR